MMEAVRTTVTARSDTSRRRPGPTIVTRTEHPSLTILGYSQAAMFLRGERQPDVAGVISIHGAREFGVDAPRVAHRLDLVFDDVDVAPAASDDVAAVQRAAVRRRWAEQIGLIETPPVRADVAAIIEFAKRVQGVDGLLLCHCGAGMSRAPAAASICLAVWRGTGAEDECIAEVRRIRPGASPHPGLVRFADELLGRGGALVRAARPVI
jgi:predicted protein tyrosine phosphatase